MPRSTTGRRFPSSRLATSKSTSFTSNHAPCGSESGPRIAVGLRPEATFRVSIAAFIASEEELQKKAAAEGSLGSPRTCRPRDCGLLRVSLENLVIAGDTAEIWVSNERVESATEAATPSGPSNPAVNIGGFCELQLRKTGGQWTIVESACAVA